MTTVRRVLTACAQSRIQYFKKRTANQGFDGKPQSATGDPLPEANLAVNMDM